MKRLLACLTLIAVLALSISQAAYASFPSKFWQEYDPSTAFPQSSAPALPPDNPSDGPLLVITRVVPPFVIDTADDPKKLCVGSITLPGVDGREFCGYSQELLQLIAKKLNREIAPQTLAQTADEIVAKLGSSSSQYNLAIGNMSVTGAREEVIDFSMPLPILNSGVQIMTRSPEASKPNILQNMWSGITGETARQIYPFLGLIVLLMLGTATAVYFVERRHKTSFLHDTPWLKGIAEAFWWILTTIFGQEEVHPRRLVSRIIAFVWIPFGVISVSLFTAAVTASLTAQQIQNTIQGLDDLRTKKVLTVDGSTSKRFLEEQGVKAQTVGTINQAYPRLESGEFDAVVYDAPALQYYADHAGKNKVVTVGKLLKRESYAIAFPENSPLRGEFNKALLELQEEGFIDRLNYKWFEAK